jgi:hypothetical protein
VKRLTIDFMKRSILILLLFTFFINSNAQIVRGTILDKSNGNKIENASVFINGTSAGTYTDKEGYFELDITRYSLMPVTISALGYYSVTINDYSKDKPFVTSLMPKTFQLNEVVINSKKIDRERRANLKIFKDEFVGITENAAKCVIMNENDIRFVLSSDNDTLKAVALKPLEIYNNALGYKITYFLDKFEYSRQGKTFNYEGNVIFNEDLATEDTKSRLFERKRKYAYQGSRIQFFRALWSDNLKSTGFLIKNSKYEILDYKDLVVVGDSLKKYLSYNNDLKIYYYSKYPNSYIYFIKKNVYFDRNGYFDASGLIWEGQMVRQRIGDLLPYEYKME